MVKLKENSKNEYDFTICCPIYLTAANGCQRLLLQGHMFLRNRVRNNKVFWVCWNYPKTKCKCRCSLQLNSGILTSLPVDHNHLPPSTTFIRRINSQAIVRSGVYSSHA